MPKIETLERVTNTSGQLFVRLWREGHLYVVSETAGTIVIIPYYAVTPKLDPVTRASIIDELLMELP